METNNFHKHDNIDWDVIEISKSMLRLKLEECAQHARIPSEAGALGGLAITLLTAAFLTERFYNVWSVPGETFRAVFITGGIASAVVALRRLWQWHNTKGDHSPEAIVSSLTLVQTKPTLMLPAGPVAEERPKKARKSVSNTVSQYNILK